MKLERLILVSCILFLTIFQLSALCYADIFEAQQLLSFADSLFQEEDYANAIHEYRRYLFLYPESSLADDVQYRIAASNQNAGNFSAAIEAYQKLKETYPSSTLVPKAQTKVAECYMFMGQYSKAIEAFRQFLSQYPDDSLAPRVQFLLGACFLEQRNWEAASQEFKTTSQRYSDSPFAAAGKDLAGAVIQGSFLPKRKGLFSGIMSSVIPGLGQTYNGRLKDGLYALLVVGATASGTIYYVKEERYKIAVPLGIVSLIFYAGNIYGGGRSAQLFNARKESEFLSKLRARIKEAELFTRPEK